jgi:hypothetical protein
MRLICGSFHFPIDQKNRDTNYNEKQDQKGKSKKLERAPQSETIKSGITEYRGSLALSLNDRQNLAYAAVSGD